MTIEYGRKVFQKSFLYNSRQKTVHLYYSRYSLNKFPLLSLDGYLMLTIYRTVGIGRVLPYSFMGFRFQTQKTFSSFNE